MRNDVGTIWKEYEQDITYKQALKLQDTVKINNKFYDGDQWSGLNAPDLQKPVVNILKPAVKYYTSMIVSDDIGVGIEDFDDMGESKQIEGVLKNEIDKVFENNRFSKKLREFVKACAVDGDAALFLHMEQTKSGVVKVLNEALEEEQQEILGKIKIEIVDNVNVHFANVIETEVQEQPFIILSSKKYLDDVKREAAENGQDPESIEADGDGSNYEETDKYVTVLLKMWKEEGTIKAIKTTRTAIVKDEWDLGFDLYPLVWMSWEKRKNSYHGVAAITAEIQNQVFINKMLAMGMRYQTLYAFPKVFYDRTKFPSGFNNRIGEAVATNGNPSEAVFSTHYAPQMNNQAMELVNLITEKTKDVLGVYDAALGNVKPDNTSAIIAVQRAASQPLELQKMDLYQAVEDVIRIIVEMMVKLYGIRSVKQSVPQQDPMTGKVSYVTVVEAFDFRLIKDFKDRVNVEVGGSSYWSELTQVQTLDNLMNLNIIPDPVTYLRAIPEGYIKNKEDIIEAIQDKEEQMSMQAQAQAQAQPPLPEMM